MLCPICQKPSSKRSRLCPAHRELWHSTRESARAMYWSQLQQNGKAVRAFMDFIDRVRAEQQHGSKS